MDVWGEIHFYCRDDVSAEDSHTLAMKCNNMTKVWVCMYEDSTNTIDIELWRVPDNLESGIRELIPVIELLQQHQFYAEDALVFKCHEVVKSGSIIISNDSNKHTIDVVTTSLEDGKVRTEMMTLKID